jgi:hypothetical protein
MANAIIANSIVFRILKINSSFALLYQIILYQRIGGFEKEHAHGIVLKVKTSHGDIIAVQAIDSTGSARGVYDSIGRIHDVVNGLSIDEIACIDVVVAINILHEYHLKVDLVVEKRVVSEDIVARINYIHTNGVAAGNIVSQIIAAGEDFYSSIQ